MKPLFNSDLVYQVVRAKLLNKKRSVASTKDRSEVRGGGRKPWAQKGTGRARAGSNRSPIWEGGGITFGPRAQRNYTKVIPAKMAKRALGMVLGKKQEHDEVKVYDDFTLAQSKTKLLAVWLHKTAGHDASSLIVPSKDIDKVKRAGHNIRKVSVKEAENVDVVDLLSHKYLVISKEALAKLEIRVQVNSKRASLSSKGNDKVQSSKLQSKIEK